MTDYIKIFKLKLEKDNHINFWRIQSKTQKLMKKIHQ